MAQDKILVIEDEQAVAELLKEWLEQGDFEVITALDGTSGLRDVFNHRPDLALIDIMMPGMDGFQLCQSIREVSEIPIIVLSAKGHEMDKVRGLQLGADDYLVKPVGGKELLARVGAALRRARMTPVHQGDFYSDGVVRLDFRKHESFVRGQPVVLTATEYRLLTYLVQNPDRVLTHQQIWDRVWGWEAGSLNSVKWHVAFLRKKVEENPDHPALITTVRGVGYRYQKPPSP